MTTRFERAFQQLLKWEGGLVHNPADPGGWTKFGVSLRWLQTVGVDITGDGVVDERDIKALTPAKAEGLYHKFFWDDEYDRLQSDAVALYVFDMDCNMGQDRAHRIAQEAANALGARLTVDGKLGPKSVAALNAVDQAALLERMRELRSTYYRNLATQKPALAVFLKGWLDRAAHA